VTDVADTSGRSELVGGGAAAGGAAAARGSCSGRCAVGRPGVFRRVGWPSTPMETYLLIMSLKFHYGLGYESLCSEGSDLITWRRFCRIPIDHQAHRPQAADGHHRPWLRREEGRRRTARPRRPARRDPPQRQTGQGQTGRRTPAGVPQDREVASLKRGYGWDRTRLDGTEGARIWTGQGVFAHNLVKIGAVTS